jgi:hypothetical protein
MLIFFLVVCFIAGGTGVGRRVREHPALLAIFSTVVAASFYSLRVVL